MGSIGTGIFQFIIPYIGWDYLPIFLPLFIICSILFLLPSIIREIKNKIEEQKYHKLLSFVEVNKTNMYTKIIHRKLINKNKEFIKSLTIDNKTQIKNILNNFFINFNIFIKEIKRNKYQLIPINTNKINQDKFLRLRRLYGPYIKKITNYILKYDGKRWNQLCMNVDCVKHTQKKY